MATTREAQVTHMPSMGQTSNHWTDLPSWEDFLRKNGKEPKRGLGLLSDASFVLHHLSTVAMARDNAPLLRSIKNKWFRKHMDELNLNDGVTRAVQMPEIKATNGRLSHKDFMAACDFYQKPLIVRGWFAGTEAVKKLSAAKGLADALGDLHLPCVIRDSLKFNRDRVPMTIREFADRVAAGEHLYLSGEMELTKPGSPIIPMLELERFEEATQKTLEMTRLYSFGGLSGGTGTAMHCGEYASLFYCVAGKKRWKMLRPDYSPVMNPIASKFYARLILADGYDGCEDIQNLEEYWAQYKFLPHYVGDIEAGDLIVVPGWWWHHVENLGTGFTLGVDLDTIHHYPMENKLLTYTVRTDLSPIRRRFSPWEKNRLARMGLD